MPGLDRLPVALPVLPAVAEIEPKKRVYYPLVRVA